MDSPAIQRAIDACTSSGGGVVYLQPGSYLCGTVVLKSNVTLYLEAGAVLLGSPNIDDYKPGHLIFASNAQNIGIAGPGKDRRPGFQFLEAYIAQSCSRLEALERRYSPGLDAHATPPFTNARIRELHRRAR